MAVTVPVRVICLLGLLSLAGCQPLRDIGVLPEPDPMDARAERLRLPPDLAVAGERDLMAIPDGQPKSARQIEQAATVVAPAPAPGMAVHKAGGQRWLQIALPPERAWQLVKDYLAKGGLAIARENPTLGILQTDWIGHATALPRGVFTPATKDLGDAQVADHYQIRIERGERADTSEVFVAHRRMARNGHGGWQPRPADPFLEAELLRGLMLLAGAQPAEAASTLAGGEAAAPAAALDRAGDGQLQLLVRSSGAEAWRRVGIAIDRLGFTVEDRDRARGRYFIRYDPQADSDRQDPGVLGALAFWRDEEPDSLQPYVIVLDPAGGRTRVVVVRPDGEPAPDEVAERILALLAEQLR